MRMATMLVVAAAAGLTLVGVGVGLARGTQPGQGDQPSGDQQPTYGCSIKVPPGGGDSNLDKLAKVPLAQATQAAQAAVPGSVLRSSLDNENDCLVYSVELRSSDGKIHDLKVDAGTAKVVHQETGRHAGDEHEGSNEGGNGAED
jgi:hypothetical protein